MNLSDSAWFSWPETTTLIRAFDGAPVRFVGGAVRDSLLNIVVNDVDLATPLLPEKVSEILTKAGIKVVPTGITHGTVTAVVGKHHFEITTLRRDVSTDGRRATVAYTDDWREDASRRDFTMNALYCDTQGEVTDYFGGVEDARQGRVKFIGDPMERISEDALRILRFFRFLAYYGRGLPDGAALAACHAQADKINNLSGERIQQEMLKLLMAHNCTHAVALMQEHAILSHVIDGKVNVDSLRRLPQALEQTGIEKHSILALALLLRSAGNAMLLVEKISSRWKLSKAYARLLSDLCSSTPTFADCSEQEIKKMIRAAGKELFIMLAVMRLAEGDDMKVCLRAVQLARQWHVPAFPLTGGDLIEHGIKSGKEMGALLAELESYWEEKEYRPTKAELLEKTKGRRYK